MRRGVLFVLALALGIATAIDAFLIEPYAIEVTRHRVAAPQLARSVTIAHLSDLHTRGLGPREKKMLRILERERPDLVVVTGDILHSLGRREDALAVLRRLAAPLGVWVVRGNWDVFEDEAAERRFYRDAGVRFLLNRGELVLPGFYLMGFDDEPEGSPAIYPVLVSAPRRAFKVALQHFPIYFDEVAGHADLALAGHTHGGQVKLPLLPPLWLPDGCGDYVHGWYERRGSRMYVSRGLGLSFYPLRFNARPEMAFHTLLPQW